MFLVLKYEVFKQRGVMRSIVEMEINKKIVLLRLDLNVPLNQGRIIDFSRIEAALPTIRYCISRNAKIIIMSHFGNPKGKFVNNLSLEFLVSVLSDLVGVKVHFASLSEIRDKLSFISEGEIILLENLRFHEGEESNNVDFSKSLASLGDVYINDAFSCYHRNHASIISVSNFIDSAFGFHFLKEIDFLKKIFFDLKRPFIAILGGSKISTKLNLINRLNKVCDKIILCGGLANSVLKFKGINVGKSLYQDFNGLEEDSKIILPQDVITARDDKSEIHVCDVRDIPKNEMILDIGPASVIEIKKEIKKSKTLVWNGPLGLFESKPFDEGTNAIAHCVAQCTDDSKVISVIGGGDTAAATKKFHNSFTHLSTGGGAFLFWLENNL